MKGNAGLGKSCSSSLEVESPNGVGEDEGEESDESDQNSGN